MYDGSSDMADVTDNVLRATIENSKLEAAQKGKVDWIEIVRGTNLVR